MNAVRLRHALRFAFHQHRTSGRRDDRPPSFSDLLQGRDLADIATVVLGNNRNLMLAPGGLLEHTGDRQGAAKIHRANGSMLRAAHLFERAAREAPVQR